MFEQGVKYLLLIAMPIAFGIAVLSKDIVLLLYTDEYLPSVLPLQILIISLIFSYLSFPIGAFLNACDKQKAQTAIVGTVMVVNIFLNIILIPRLGVAGAAVAALVGNVLLTVFGYFIVPKITHVSHGYIAKTFFQILFSAGGMALAVYAVNTQVNFFYAILVGAVIYPILLFLTRSVCMVELKEALQLIRK